MKMSTKPESMIYSQNMLLVFIGSAFFSITGVTTDCLKKQEKYVSGGNTDLTAALQFLESNDRLFEKYRNKVAIAAWNYETNVTQTNMENYLKMTNEMTEFKKETWVNATSFAWKNFKEINKTAYRWFKSQCILGPAALPEDKYSEFNNILADMQNVYSSAQVCSYLSSNSEKCTLSDEPELTKIMQNSTNYDELKHVWAKWRDEIGTKKRNDYLRYIELSNEAACLNGFSDAAKQWQDEYESDEFIEELDQLWNTIEPFYQQLHAYVRRKLINKYTSTYINNDGPIPAHLLGTMGAENWANIYHLVAPYPNKLNKMAADVTDAMKRKSMTALDIFKLSEEFFTSLGLMKMTPEFWNHSIIEKPNDRTIVCRDDFSWDFFNKGDFRIKICTKVDMEDLIIIHHEMGHIQYLLQYNDQPAVFRNGANTGFHEAIGNVVSLSVLTRDYMKKIGLLEEASQDKDVEINDLLKVALEKIAFVPFGLVTDIWRWKLFDGSIKRSESNTEWWRLKLKYQGLCPPVLRTENDLDALSNYFVVADVPYIWNSISNIIEFQIHKALCEEAGHKGPLNQCDIYQNKDAGKLLSDMLKLGSSVSWRDAIKVITKGKTDKMDGTAILEYFKPLHDWLKEQNKDEYIGWKSDNPMMCPSSN